MSLPVTKVCSKGLNVILLKSNEFCIIFDIYYFISCLISIVILSLCIYLFLLSFLVRYRVKTMQEREEREKMCQNVA